MTITCYRCKKEKDASEFYNSKRSKNNKCGYCKSCSYKFARDWYCRKNYGKTLEECNDLEKRQSGRCAICKRLQSETSNIRLAVDHDHETGVVRGMLCYHCNRNIEWMINHGEAASEYLLNSIKGEQNG